MVETHCLSRTEEPLKLPLCREHWLGLHRPRPLRRLEWYCAQAEIRRIPVALVIYCCDEVSPDYFSEVFGLIGLTGHSAPCLLARAAQVLFSSESWLELVNLRWVPLSRTLSMALILQQFLPLLQLSSQAWRRGDCQASHGPRSQRTLLCYILPVKASHKTSPDSKWERK